MIEKKIHISDYTYNLPEDRIARYPLENRDQSKLLVFDKQKKITPALFYNIVDFLPKNSLLVFNNTRVIHARLEFKKKTGSRIEIFCLKPFNPIDYQQILSATNSCSWICMVGNLKKWKDEILEMELTVSGKSFFLQAEKSGLDKTGSPIITFRWGDEITFAQVLEHSGRIPIPPYLNRESEEIDTTRYQTVYSAIDGSVAAPTAGLHFTPEVLASLDKSGIKTCELTLHVGAGTFQPVKAENAREHKMHGEMLVVEPKLIDALLSGLSNIVATGTTSMRSLESIYWLGVKIIRGFEPTFLGQWEWENLDNSIPVKNSLEALQNYFIKHKNAPIHAVTEIMIVPGYTFKMAEMLITNFHQPNSTLLLLIAAITIT